MSTKATFNLLSSLIVTFTQYNNKKRISKANITMMKEMAEDIINALPEGDAKLKVGSFLYFLTCGASMTAFQRADAMRHLVRARQALSA